MIIKTRRVKSTHPLKKIDCGRIVDAGGYRMVILRNIPHPAAKSPPPLPSPLPALCPRKIKEEESKREKKIMCVIGFQNSIYVVRQPQNAICCVFQKPPRHYSPPPLPPPFRPPPPPPSRRSVSENNHKNNSNRYYGSNYHHHRLVLANRWR